MSKKYKLFQCTDKKNNMYIVDNFKNILETISKFDTEPVKKVIFKNKRYKTILVPKDNWVFAGDREVLRKLSKEKRQPSLNQRLLKKYFQKNVIMFKNQ